MINTDCETDSFEFSQMLRKKRLDKIWTLFNTRTKTVEIHGPVLALKAAAASLQVIMKFASDQLKRLRSLGSHSDLQRTILNGSLTADSSKACNACHCNGESDNIFALLVEEDWTAISIWTDFMLPTLPGILTSQIGHNYTISLVRQGPSEQTAHPCIRIQSPQEQYRAVQDKITLIVSKICVEHGLQPLPLHFSIGCFRLLTGLNQVTEPNENDLRNMHYRRHWEKPGMGATIGMRCSKLGVATLGGYVLVDGERYILTVDHFIDRGLKLNDNNASATRNGVRHEITSPALADVEEVGMKTHSNIVNIRQTIDNISESNYEIASTTTRFYQGPSRELQKLRYALDLFEEVGKSQSKSEDEYIIGSTIYRCGDHFRDLPSTLGSSSAPVRYMDWALLNPTNRARAGENRHRYRYGSEKADFWSQSEKLEGAGDLCEEVCSLKGGEEVHYVGAASGSRTGKINPAPTLVVIGGRTTIQNCVISDERISNVEMLEGDSGAWVLQKSNNSLGALLYSFANGMLLCSLIGEVFSDIKNLYGKTIVDLPRGSRDSDAVRDSNAIEIPVAALISGERKQGIGLTQPYDFDMEWIPDPGSKEPSLPADLNVLPEPLLPGDGSMVTDIIQVDKASPVPSLDTLSHSSLEDFAGSSTSSSLFDTSYSSMSLIESQLGSKSENQVGPTTKDADAVDVLDGHSSPFIDLPWTSTASVTFSISAGRFDKLSSKEKIRSLSHNQRDTSPYQWSEKYDRLRGRALERSGKRLTRVVLIRVYKVTRIGKLGKRTLDTRALINCLVHYVPKDLSQKIKKGTRNTSAIRTASLNDIRRSKLLKKSSTFPVFRVPK